jgi:hypothetical protein
MGSIDLLSLAHAGLGEDGQQDNPTPGGDPIRHPDGRAAQVESQFPQLAVQLAGLGLTQKRTLLGQQVDVESCIGEPCCR